MTDWTAEDAEWLRGAPGDPDDHERRVRYFLELDRAKRDARRRLAAEGQDTTPPAMETLRDRLAVPRLPTPPRIAGWQLQHSRVLLAAQFKAGKTTLVGNVIRSLVDGDAFLGQYDVTPIAGTLGLFDTEMGDTQGDDWLRAQRIRHDDRVVPLYLRGRAGAFNILDDSIRGGWAERLKQLGCTYVVLDCVRPLFDAFGLDEHREAGQLLVAFDALLREAGIPEALVVQHMGHTGERSRGDSRLRDWPDAEWRLVRRDEDPASPRFITAYGRDVDVPESLLDFTLDGRRLTIAGGSRREAAAAEALADVLAALNEASGPLSARAIERAAAQSGSGFGRDRIRAAISYGVRERFIRTETGARGAILHAVSDDCASARALRGQCASAVLSECAGAYISAAQSRTQDPDLPVFDPTAAFGRGAQ